MQELFGSIKFGIEYETLLHDYNKRLEEDWKLPPLDDKNSCFKYIQKSLKLLKKKKHENLETLYNEKHKKWFNLVKTLNDTSKSLRYKSEFSTNVSIMMKDNCIIYDQSRMTKKRCMSVGMWR